MHQKIWPDFNLLMPVCAVGNIGQLACDLIISTLLQKQECQLIGRLYSPALMSVVGPNAFSLKGPPTTSTEVYESKKHKLVIIQQRTSYFKSLKQLYIEELVNWIKESKFDKVFVLSSSFSQCNPDTSALMHNLELGIANSSAISYITTSNFEIKDETAWQNLNLKPIPDKKTISVIQEGYLSFLPGSGFTRPLIKSFKKAFISAAFLISFCSEGINIHDCYQVVNIVNKLLNLGCGQDAEAIDCDDSKTDQMAISRAGWHEPFSWTQAQC